MNTVLWAHWLCIEKNHSLVRSLAFSLSLWMWIWALQANVLNGIHKGHWLVSMQKMFKKHPKWREMVSLENAIIFQMEDLLTYQLLLCILYGSKRLVLEPRRNHCECLETYIKNSFCYHYISPNCGDGNFHLFMNPVDFLKDSKSAYVH